MVLYFQIIFIIYFLIIFILFIPNLQNNTRRVIHIELLSLKNDYTFKRIFGYRGNEAITIDLLNSILKDKVSKINLNCEKILEKDLYDDKIGILDIRATINDNIDCDIEMQVVDKDNIEKRLLFYLSKMYTGNLTQGTDYSKLKKCIAILFTDFNLSNLSHIPKYLTKWNFREEDYSKIILTDAIEIYIIELPKVEQFSKNSKLDTWVKFITKSGDIDMENSNDAIKKAKEVLEEISQDEHERYLAHLRQKHILDQNAIEKAGFNKGLKQGIERGLEQGTKNSQIQIAKKLKEKNIDITIISETTGLTKEEITNL